MLRSMMQMYVKNSAKAVELYLKAFNATIGNEYRNSDGSCMHVELNAFGQILAISEATDDIIIGNNMQFCLHFEENEVEKVKHAYEVLRDGAIGLAEKVVSNGRYNFQSENVNELWEQLKDKATVIEPLFDTLWGTRKFTIADPDGNELGFN